MQTLVTVGAVCLLVGGGMGWWVGDGLADGRCAQRELDVAVQYAENGNQRIEEARRALADQHRRAIARAADELRTVKVWCRRDDTAMSVRLRLPGGQIAGVDNDVSATMTAAIDTWEEIPISFTPTEAGVVEIFGEAWSAGYPDSAWFDDLTVS